MDPIRYTNFDGLLNTGVCDFLLKDNELNACKNVWVHQVGRLEKVPGSEKATASQVVNLQSINYLHHYYRPSTQTNYLLGFSDSGGDYIVKYRTTGSWTSVTSGSWTNRNGAQVDVENYLDKAFIVGYDNGTFLANATISGTTMSTSDTDITDMPKGKFIVRYRDLLYVLHCYEDSTLYPNRAYYCDEPEDGAIGWTGKATQYVEFGYDDGDEITGACEALDRLIVFKRYSMWKYDESERKKVADIGCDSYRSIFKINGGPYWFNRDGFWRFDGSLPQLISAKIQKFVDAIDQNALDEVVGGVYHGDEARWYVGNVTVDGIDYDNTWVCFNVYREHWYIRCTSAQAKSACSYTEGGSRRLYFGDNSGYVYKFSEKIDGIYTDDESAIDSFFVTKAFDYGAPEQRKFANHLTFFTKYIQGMKVSVDADRKGSFQAAHSQMLAQNVDIKDFMAEGYRFTFKFHENGTGKSWQFEGFVVEIGAKGKDQ